MALGLQDRKKIAQPYGQAFMQAMDILCKNDSKLQETLVDQIATLEESLSFPSLNSFFKHAHQHNKDRVIGAMDVLGGKGKFHDIIVNLLKLLAKNRRLEAIPEILHFIQEQIYLSQNLGHTKITSAKELSVQEIKSLKPLLPKLFPNERTTISYKDYVVSTKTDPSLLGGIVIQLGSLRVDSSLKGKFAKLAHVLKS